MNIVYFTHLSGKKSAGLTYSVPKQICAQSQIDNVYWFNSTDYNINDWYTIKHYHDKNNVKNCKIKSFPKPFNKPDIVIFESFYSVRDYIESKYLIKNKIPYVIIPRGALTVGAQTTKKVKKQIANYLFFKEFANKAVGIQYLTKHEFKDSGDEWNKNGYVIPNGIHTKENVKQWEDKSMILGVFIGRIDIFHKGIDILMKSCFENRIELIANNVNIEVYGPHSKDTCLLDEYIKKLKLENIVSIKGPIYDYEKEKVILKSDFFVLSSRFEGHPMGLIEALSYGIPCLVSRGTNMLDEILEADAGWGSENNVEAFSSAMKKMIKEKKMMKEKGNNAILLSNEYKWDLLAIKSYEKYSEFIMKIKRGQ